jgi:proteasome accessory factor A
MTKDKDFKDLVRARSAQTGEHYTSAREALLHERRDDDAPGRIIGVESRYVGRAVAESGDALTPGDVARYLFQRVVTWGRSSNVYLENGARLYLVAGPAIEYATPECASIREVLVHVRAGEARLGELADAASRRLREEALGQAIEIEGDPSAAGGASENYCAARSLTPQAIAQVLVPFLVTRQIFTGSGGVVATPDGERFVLSPRAYLLSEQGAPALFNADARAHADVQRFRRVRVDLGDVNRSDVATFLKVGTTALVLRLAEERAESVAVAAIGDPVAVLLATTLDTTCRAAIQVQRAILTAVARHIEEAGSTEEEQLVVAGWRDVLDRLSDDPASAADLVDWVAGDGPAPTLPVVSAAEVNAAIHVPPTRTRAHLRGQFIQACTAARRDYTVDWTHLKLNDQQQRTIVLPDPSMSDDERVDRMLEAVRAG